MSNPIMNLLGNLQNSAMSNGLNQITGMAKSLSNPQAAIQQMLQNNPNTSKVMDLINQNGGDPKTVFYKVAKEKGIDPDAFVKQIKGMF